MKKLLLTMGLGLSLQATADTYVIDTDACAGDEYIYDQSGDVVKYDPEVHTFVTAETSVYYAAYEKIPHIRLAGAYTGFVHVTNTSSNTINFFYKPTYYSETSTTISSITPEIYYGAFSSTNSPRNSGGASMSANTYGRIHLNYQSGKYVGSAVIYWDSSTCMSTPPLEVTYEQFYANGSQDFAGMSHFLINEGNPW